MIISVWISNLSSILISTVSLSVLFFGIVLFFDCPYIIVSKFVKKTSWENRPQAVLPPKPRTANLRTKTLDCRGLDSSRIWILRGGIPRSVGNFPETPSQRILAGIILVGRLGVHPRLYIYIYIYIIHLSLSIYIYTHIHTCVCLLGRPLPGLLVPGPVLRVAALDLGRNKQTSILYIYIYIYIYII